MGNKVEGDAQEGMRNCDGVIWQREAHLINGRTSDKVRVSFVINQQDALLFLAFINVHDSLVSGRIKIHCQSYQDAEQFTGCTIGPLLSIVSRSAALISYFLLFILSSLQHKPSDFFARHDASSSLIRMYTDSLTTR